MSIGLYWCKEKNLRGENFGDALSRIIVEMISEETVEFSDDPGKLVAVGTLFDRVVNGDIVWGTGAAKMKKRYTFEDVSIYAVRGPLTREVLIQSGIDCPDVYGDPGILIKDFYNPEVEKEYKIGVIPHYVDYEKIKNMEGVKVIDILSGVKNVICEIKKCEQIYSSCLHGIIAAEAYGVPTQWIKLGNRIGSPVFKFQDYYASTARTGNCLNWTQGAKYEMNLEAPMLKDMKEELIDNFPYDIGYAFELGE